MTEWTENIFSVFTEKIVIKPFNPQEFFPQCYGKLQN